MDYHSSRSTTIQYDESLRLSDGNITLRPLSIEDVDEYHAAIIESLPDLIPWMSYSENHTVQNTRKELKQCREKWEANDSYDFAITDSSDGKIIGFCILNRIDNQNRVANLGYWVRSSCSGKGIAPAATVLLAKWALDTCGFRRIELSIAKQNKRSLLVAEKAGAHREGVLRNRFTTNNESRDVVMFSFIPGDI
jgi:RimJ/RimL family protein N-acetyltransferase